MMINELQKNVLKWAEDKGILSKATLLTQINKTQEELTETRDAMLELRQLNLLFGDEACKFPFYLDKYNELNTGIIDGIGDQLVTLIILAELHGSSITECLEHAWNEIKDRTGKMIDGTFVKD